MPEAFTPDCACPRKDRGKHRAPCVYAPSVAPKARHANKYRKRLSVVSPGIYANWLIEQRLALPEDQGWAGVYRCV